MSTNETSTEDEINFDNALKLFEQILYREHEFGGFDLKISGDAAELLLNAAIEAIQLDRDGYTRRDIQEDEPYFD